MSSTYQKIAFIVNPISGGKSKKSIIRVIEEKLDSTKYLPEIHYTNYQGHGYEIAKKLLDRGLSKIIAVGGDGTVNEIARALVHTNAILGIIPVGSGNGLARHLNISLNPAKAISIINLGFHIQMDTGYMNDLPFFCTSGVGFDAYIGRAFAQAEARGFRTYIKSTIYEFLHYKPHSYTLTFPGKEIQTEAFLITIGNASQYGNNAFICPYADVQDGLLDVSIITPFPKLAAWNLGRRLFSKSIHKSKYTQTYKTRLLKIRRVQTGPVHIDGEPLDMGEEINFRIEPNSLNVFVNK